MTPDEAVYAALLTSGLPGTYDAWPLGQSSPLPWFVYRDAKGGEVFADDSNYTKMHRYEVDLYQRERDPEVQETFETALKSIGPYACTDKWVSSENCKVISYSVTYHPHS